MEVILFIVGRFYVLGDEDCKFRLTSVWIGFFQDLVGCRIIFFADGSFGFLPHFAEGQTLLTSWFLLGFRTVERVVGNLVAIDITSTPRRSVSSTCQKIMLIWYVWDYLRFWVSITFSLLQFVLNVLQFPVVIAQVSRVDTEFFLLARQLGKTDLRYFVWYPTGQADKAIFCQFIFQQQTLFLNPAKRALIFFSVVQQATSMALKILLSQLKILQGSSLT